MIGFLLLDLLIKEHISTPLFFIQALLPFLLFPVVLLFALETLHEKGGNLRAVLFLPVGITAFYIAADLFLFHDYSEAELTKLYNFPTPIYHLLYKGNQIFFIGSLIWLVKKLAHYRMEIKEKFSYIDPISLHWLTRFSWIYLILTSLSLSIFVISNLSIFPINVQTVYSIVSAGVVLSIFYLSYHGIKQYSVTEYYSHQPEGVQANLTTDQPPGKYKTSSLSREEQESIYHQLLKLFEEKTIYCEPKLQLEDVANSLEVTVHALSQTINTMAGKPFYDFVNAYRVKNLQKLLEDPKQKSFKILALGMNSGFNSKTSLNRVFKEHTGLSPSEYQKRHLRN